MATSLLTGTSRLFSAGADIREFGTPDASAEPTLSDVIDELDAADKPVIAAIDGTCLGGGLEVALSAHYCIATRASTLGLPEVLLGLVPGAGGTQRLPRAVGAGLAAQMITGGQTRPASALGDIPGQRILDKIVDHNAAAAAIELAYNVAETRPLPRIRDGAVDSDGALAFDAIRAQLVGRSRGLDAPLAALDLIEQAGTTSFREGLVAERETFLRLEAGEQSTALRHAIFAERAVRKVPGIAPHTRIRDVEKVAVIGAGTNGRRDRDELPEREHPGHDP